MTTQAQIFGHLLITVMELDTEDIQALHDACYRSYNTLNNITYDNIVRLRDRHIVSICAWRELTNWKMYADATNSSYALIMKMI